MPKTDKRAYIRHTYSGPRKSRNRVRAALKNNNHETSRDVVWRQPQKFIDQQRQTLATEPAETTVQPSTSSDQIEVQAQSTWNTKWSSSNIRFKTTFLDNDFGYACSVCDRLWFRNDLKSITAAQLKHPDAESSSDSDLYSDLPGSPNHAANTQSQPNAKTQGETHHHVKCNECQAQICGFRYVCVQCSDWDMCGGCEARGAHSQHYVLRLPGARPQEKVKSLIEAIQKQLQTLLEDVETLQVVKLEDEIKIEYNDVDIKVEATDMLEETTDMLEGTTDMLERNTDTEDDDEIQNTESSPIIKKCESLADDITQFSVTQMEDNLERAIASITPDDQCAPSTSMQDIEFVSFPTSSYLTMSDRNIPSSHTIVYTKPEPARQDPTPSSSFQTEENIPDATRKPTLVYKRRKFN